MTRNDPWHGSYPPPEDPEAAVKRRRGRLFGWAALFLCALVIGGIWLLITQVMMPFFNEQMNAAFDAFNEEIVTTSDMVPTLLPGDRILTAPLHWSDQVDIQIDRGDIVLIGEEPNARFLRVAALAGDTVIQLASGEVEVVSLGQAGDGRTYCAGLEGAFEGRRQYVILESNFYLLGDNCLEASDSRDFAIGPVGYDAIVAVAIWRQVPDGLPEVLKNMEPEKSDAAKP